MGTSAQRRQFQDVWSKIATATVTASPGAITNNTQAVVSVTIPGVALDGTWEVLHVGYNASQGAVVVSGMIDSANTVKLYITNNSGGSVTPTANTKYTVVVGQIDARFTTL